MIYLPNNLIKIPSGGRRISKGKPDGFLGVDYEDSSDLDKDIVQEVKLTAFAVIDSQ